MADLKWVPVGDVALVNGAEYCVGRGAKCEADIGTWYADTGWSCMGDEWPDVKEMPVLFVLNGMPLPNHTSKGTDG